MTARWHQAVLDLSVALEDDVGIRMHLALEFRITGEVEVEHENIARLIWKIAKSQSC